MGIVSKFNHSNPFSNIVTDGFNYVDLTDIESHSQGKPYVIHGMYVQNKGKFGPEPVAINKDDKVLINLPHFLVDDVKEMLADQEVIDAIKANKVGIQVTHFTNAYSKRDANGNLIPFCSVEWIDL